MNKCYNISATYFSHAIGQGHQGSVDSNISLTPRVSLNKFGFKSNNKSHPVEVGIRTFEMSACFNGSSCNLICLILAECGAI